jgi:hypothetical protein
MAEETLTQDQIDILLKGITSGEAEVDESVLMHDSTALAKLRKDVDSAKNRYIFRLEGGGRIGEIAYARRYLKQAAHRFWLKSHGFYDRNDFKQWLKRNIVWDPSQGMWVKKEAQYRN